LEVGGFRIAEGGLDGQTNRESAIRHPQIRNPQSANLEMKSAI
jgi:hypothetical protein